MRANDIDRPIFFVGMPRSGTTVIFQTFAARPDVAWFSQLIERVPRFPSLAVLSRLADVSSSMRKSESRSDQARPWLEKLRVGPSEAYRVWERCCGEKFRDDYLLGIQATAEERDRLRATISKVLRFQGKPRFAAKITGPGRIGYLSSVFEDARFVHVVRDGRATVQSLMRVPFWRDKRRMDEPAWRNGLTQGDLADWEARGRSPLALTALQWRRVVESTRDEAARFGPDRYAELCYERFVAEPHQFLDELAAVCGLPGSPEAHEFLERRFELRDMNFQWEDTFRSEEVKTLNDLMGSTLERFGYDVDPPRPPAGGPRVTRPFVTT